MKKKQKKGEILIYQASTFYISETDSNIRFQLILSKKYIFIESESQKRNLIYVAESDQKLINELIEFLELYPEHIILEMVHQLLKRRS